MPGNPPLATYAFPSGDLAAALEFLKRTRAELRTLRRVEVGLDELRIYDVNRDCFEITGIGYPAADIVPLLNAVYAVYNPATVHDPTPHPYKEFDAGRRYPWAYDRVM